MIISPPLLKSKTEPETDNTWIARVMKEEGGREFPVNAAGSWHGGIHIRHTDDGTGRAESIRAIADGIVVSFRKASGDIKRDSAPLNMNADKAKSKGSDDGYILLKHETEIGSGDNSKVAFYSLYMHLKSLTSKVKGGEKIYRKDALGTSGMVDGVNAFHFQIFCDDDNMAKLVGRTTRELDITRDGRTDAVYGDIHFYLPAGTKFYRNAPVNNTSSTTGLAEVHTSGMPLYVSMTLEKGNCTMVTRQQEPGAEGVFTAVGAPLINADGKDYEYNLYKTAMRLYTQSPSAGFELLRFGRIINTEHETLVPEDAPHWRTVNFPGGKGMVNLAVPEIKKFSDADFPHWTGWQAVDDDQDSNSQCNSAHIKKWQEAGVYDALKNRLICHFPLEWEESTIDTRFSWLRTNADAPMSEEDYTKFKLHAEALCFNTGDLGKKRVWHFHPAEFIEHFRKCGWLSSNELKQIIPRYIIRPSGSRNYWEPVSLKENSASVFKVHHQMINKATRKYCINTPLRLASFLGNAVQETTWLSVTREGYVYSDKDENGKRYTYNIWYYPWYGRGFLQLTNPDNFYNYFTYRGRRFNNSVRRGLVNAYRRLQRDKSLRLKERKITNRILYDNQHPGLTDEVIAWRNEVESGRYAPADSAGFYWSFTDMARYADSAHIIERQSVMTNRGSKTYYRSPAFWQASATVNLPGAIGRDDYRGINGFVERCCVYSSAISVLTEMKYPDGRGDFILDSPEGMELRRL